MIKSFFLKKILFSFPYFCAATYNNDWLLYMEKSLEEQWLKKLATDDKKAYEIILKAPYQSVYLSALRITKDGNSAKDTAQ